MRIIKLSKDDPDFKEGEDVINYFENKLLNRNKGKFYLTKGKIGKKDGILLNEPIIFSYQKKIVYLARAASTVQPNDALPSNNYPHYFDIDLDSILLGKGTLGELEKDLFERGLYMKKINGSQGWNKIPHESNDREIETVWDSYKLNS